MAAELPYFPPPPSYTPKAHRQPTTKILSFTKSSGNPRLPFDQRPALFAKSTGFDNVDLPRSHSQTTWRILPNSRIWRLVDNWWLWELISWSFAALCIGATIVILAVCRGRPLPEWPWGLTINAYVSVLGAFAKAALLLPTAEALGQLKFNWFAREGGRDIMDFQVFDQASRGPWGAFLLILRTKGRALAALGAAVMVLSIALDPFFQQIVVYPSRSIRVGNSTILRSRLFAAGQFDGPMYNDGARYYTPDRSIYYFVTSLMSYNNNPKPPEIPLVCPSGNCTWEPFETLAVCSSCADISHMLTYGCMNAQEDWRLTWYNGSLWSYPKTPSCGYYLNASSNNPMLMTGFETSSGTNETLITRLLPLDYPVNGVMSYYNSSIKFQNIRNPIFNVVYSATPGGFKGVHANVTPIAMECNLRWCVQQLNSRVQDGVLEEKVVDSYTNTSNPRYPWTVDWPYLDFKYLEVPRIESKRDETSFGLTTTDDALDISTSFWTSTRSFITADNASAQPWWRYTTEAENGTQALPASVTPWWHHENITEHFQKVARTFSSVVRSVSNGTDVIEGVAYGTETFVEIRWEWLSLPLILLLFSLIFLLSSILQSRSGGMEVWKTSALAVLLHGVKQDGIRSSDDLSRHTRHHPVRKRTDRGPVLLRFKGRNGRWRFSRKL